MRGGYGCICINHCKSALYGRQKWRPFLKYVFKHVFKFLVFREKVVPLYRKTRYLLINWFLLKNKCMKKSCYVLLLCGLLCACQGEKKRDDVSVKTISWSTKNAFQIKDIVGDVQYILLEDSEEALFSEIAKLTIKGDRIYLLDISRPRSLLVFDLSGKFLYRVGKEGGGPGEYSQGLINFDVADDGTVLLHDYAKRTMLFFDKNGQFLKAEKSAFIFNDFCILPDGGYLLSADIYENQNDRRKLIRTADLNRVEEAWFSFPEDFKNNKLNIRAFQPYRDRIAYMLPVSDTLLVLDWRGNIEQAYWFDFEGNGLPENLKNDYEEAVNQRRKGVNYTYIYDAPVLVGRYLFANLFVEGQKQVAVFDLEAGTAAHEELRPDRFAVENVNFPLCAVGDSVVVSYLDANLYDAIREGFSAGPEVDGHLAAGGAVICLFGVKGE